MTPTLEQFARGVAEAGLVPESEVAAVVELLSKGDTPPDGQALATELIVRRKLTKLQVEAIWLGRPESLRLGQYVLVDKIGQGAWARSSGPCTRG